MMQHPVFGEMNDELYERLEKRNSRSQLLAQEAQRIMEDSTRIDLGNVAELILNRFPTAATCVLMDDQRQGHEGVVFVGHLKDAQGTEFTFDDKREAEYIVLNMGLQAPKKFLHRTLDLAQLIEDSEA